MNARKIDSHSEPSYVGVYEMADEKAVYTLNEAAEYLGVHPETVRRMIKGKRLAAELVVVEGRAQWRIQRKDLEKATVNPPHRPPNSN